MNSLSVTTPERTRRRFSPEFKASIIVQCRQPGVSVARIALDNDLNANLVRRWISQAREDGSQLATPGFMPISLPTNASPPASRSISNAGNTIRIEIPRAGGAVVVEWPTEQAHQCAVLLRGLLG
ncbi:IS66-like element accessory protein TnpA [Halopseudomonas pelagia]|uniref:IS66-like element accessory protein TnpA n=1 Tax=Halopseudomonas pelagia TaxID=553151 RepID=UPI0003B5F5D5|nr:transposase [Halopseudomonas pelagia]